MFNLPLSLFADARPKTRTLRAERGTETRLRLAQPPATATVSARQRHRRWTVVIPRRLTARAAQAQAEAEALGAALPPPPAPIRFGPQATMLGMIAAVASGLYVYSEKHAAAALDRQIAHAFQATSAAHQQSNLLHAEWALLNNPDRLQPLAGRYLNLQATSATQFVQVADLRSHLPAILYGPPQPVVEDDAAALPSAGKRLLAMATTPAAPDGLAMQDDTAATPIVTAPAAAIRVLAHAGAMPEIVGAGTQATRSELDSAETGLLEDDAPKPARIVRPVRLAPAPLAAAHAAPRLAAATPPQVAPRLLARAEPRPRIVHQTATLSPGLIRMLMLPHATYATSWSPRPRPSQVAPVPQRHVDYGRSDPPHFLSVPPVTQPRQAEPQYASEEPLLRPNYQERVQAWVPPAYRPPPPYYRRPYWGYNANPYGGAYMPPPGPGYPVYQ